MHRCALPLHFAFEPISNVRYFKPLPRWAMGGVMSYRLPWQPPRFICAVTFCLIIDLLHNNTKCVCVHVRMCSMSPHLFLAIGERPTPPCDHDSPSLCSTWTHMYASKTDRFWTWRDSWSEGTQREDGRGVPGKKSKGNKSRNAEERERWRNREPSVCCHGHEQKCVCAHACVQLSWQRAATHLEVSVHNIMLVDMIDTLQNLTNAMTTEREKGTNQEKDVTVTAYK